MIEITVSDIKDISGVVLVYTNMCGTCESAKRMLDIVSQTIDYFPFFQINVNFNPEIINKYLISSIPCFLVFMNGELVDKFYAFHSVTYLYQKLKSLISLH